MAFTPNPTLGNDILTGDAQADIIFALLGNDIVYAGAGNDTLDGGLGNDVLYGEAGNDILNGGYDLLPPGKEAELFGAGYFPGNDTLYGGAGDDTYLFGRASRSDRIVETAVSGETNQLRFEDGVIAADVAVRHEGNDLNFYIVGYLDNKLTVVDYFSSAIRPLTRAMFSDGTMLTGADFETVQLGPVGNADRFIRGTDSDDILTGLGGNDTIDGKDGNDRIFGGDGNDYLLGGAGRDVLRGGNGNDVILGGSGAEDQLYGDAGDDTLISGEGRDFLDGGTGNDVLDAGTGQNRIVFQKGDGQDIVRGTATATAMFTGTTIELFTSITPGTLGGGPGALASTEVVLTRTGDDLVINRNDGDDRITVEKYFTSASAGLYPVNFIRFSDTTWSSADINSRVVAGPDTPPASGITLIGTDGNDVLTGTAAADILLGRAGDDYLKGGAGNDFLNGETGKDLLEGGLGDDTLVVDNVLDAITERPGEGTDTVQSYISYMLGGNVENLTLIGNIAISATGNELDNYLVGNVLNNVMLGRTGNDVLYGDAGDDFLNGELGQDQMFGGVGNDTVIVDDAGDYVWEAANEGTDTVQSYISYTLQANFENLILIGGTGVVANGNALANVIQGNDADNRIDGRGGLDTLMGNGGNDRLTIHTGQERVSGGSGFDTLQFGANLGLLNLAGLAGVSLTGIEAIDMRNGNASTARFTLDQMLALSTESNTLKIEGDAGDQLQIGTGWQRSLSSTAGYDQYSMTAGGETGIVLVGQNVTVMMVDGMAA